jgi:hypothetical protein
VFCFIRREAVSDRLKTKKKERKKKGGTEQDTIQYLYCFGI